VMRAIAGRRRTAGVGARVSAFLGTVELQGRSAWVNAADRRLQLRCAVAPQDLHGARNGDWVIARITRHAGSASPAQAVIAKRLDPDRPVELATESAIARFDLPHEFPAAALREAQAHGEQVDAREANARVTCASCHWSPSTVRMRAISTMRCMPSHTRGAFA